MNTSAAPSPPTGRPPVSRGHDGWFERVELITPAMCGHNSLFVGQLGDWTWDAVGLSCGVDPYRAADEDGRAVYLSFAYFRVRTETGPSVEELTFGDRLRVRSKVLSCGGDSVLTLHHVQHDESPAVREAPDVDGFFRLDDDRTIRVETFNRWIQRSGEDTNHALRRATPAGFDAAHLDEVDDRHNPRRLCSAARKAATLRGHDEPVAQHRMVLRYRVSPSRDLNGVGLLYFASYFSIVDWAVQSLWDHLGRTVASFLGRSVLDRQLCFVANANADDHLDVEVSAYSVLGGIDVVDVAVRHGDGTLVAVARQRIRRRDR